MNDETKNLLTVVVAYIFLMKAISFAYRYIKIRKFYKNDMNVKNACKILGITVSQYKKMSKAELKQIYRMKVKQTHPDTNGAQSSKAFRDVQEAYEFASAT